MKQKLRIKAAYLNTKLLPFRFNQFEFKVWQNQKAIEMVRFAFKNSRFYQDLYAGLDLKAWRELPTISKQSLIENFDSFNTVGITQDESLAAVLNFINANQFSARHDGVQVTQTAGTSGQQGLFLIHPREESRLIGTALAKIFPLFRGARQKMALFVRPNSFLTPSLSSTGIAVCFFDLLKSIREQMHDLELYRPTILIAPPSILRLIAQYKKEMRLRLAPRKIYAIGEVLEPLDQAYIEGVFAQGLQQIYQAGEGFLGITCSAGVMHLNEDLFLFQEEDLGQGRFIPIITDLYNTTQPLIRYRLDDILHRGEGRCACGSYYRTIDKIEGRHEDVFVFYDTLKTRRIEVYPDSIRKILRESSEVIEEYHVVQKYANHLMLQLKLLDNADRVGVEARLKKDFQFLFKKLNVFPEAIEFSYEPLQNIPLKKQKRIEREFC